MASKLKSPSPRCYGGSPICGSMMQSGLLFLIQRNLLGMHGMHVLWAHELIRALANTVVAIPVSRPSERL